MYTAPKPGDIYNIKVPFSPYLKVKVTSVRGRVVHLAVAEPHTLAPLGSKLTRSVNWLEESPTVYKEHKHGTN